MIKVYNTLSGKKEEFKPIEENVVKMYVCGLTVQNYSHVGHIRSALNYDVIRRYLEYRGYDVHFVMNFTDINEKIVRRAREEELTPQQLAQKYTRAYLEDIDQMNIRRADAYCTATVNINQMIKIIEQLVEKDYAYEAEGNVYFDVQQFPDYGKLSGQDPEEMEAGSRVGIQEDKKHPLDFALWKKVDNDDVEVWDSPWGPGWPGWHIECSAMAVKFLGENIDIHGGGTDLVFPHHENEIAQSEACFEQEPFVKYWLHNGTVDIKGEKMSKSLGNFFTTRELLKKFTSDEIRYFLLTKHYHSPVEFSLKEIKNSASSWNRIKNLRNEIQQLVTEIPQENDLSFPVDKWLDLIKNYRHQFEKAMDDDFNTARALGTVNELVTEVNSLINDKSFTINEESRFILKKVFDLLDTILEVLGFSVVNVQKKPVVEGEQIGKDVLDYILNLREEARQEENWELADKIRDDLSEMGIKVKDTSHGPVWSMEDE